MTLAKRLRGASGTSWSSAIGMVLIAVVHAASTQDRDGAKAVIERLKHQCTRLRLIWADGGYAGALVEWVTKLRLGIVKQSDDAKGLVWSCRIAGLSSARSCG